MVWGAFSASGKSQLAVLRGNHNSECYQNTLRDYLLPFAQRCHRADWIFQQDNASIHTSGSTKKWFEDNELTVMDWPAKSPDLNLIENVWGYMARRLYENRRQFSSIADIQACVLQEWDKLNQSYLYRLIESIHKMCVDVLRVQGGAIDY